QLRGAVLFRGVRAGAGSGSTRHVQTVRASARGTGELAGRGEPRGTRAVCGARRNNAVRSDAEPGRLAGRERDFRAGAAVFRAQLGATGRALPVAGEDGGRDGAKYAGGANPIERPPSRRACLYSAGSAGEWSFVEENPVRSGLAACARRVAMVRRAQDTGGKTVGATSWTPAARPPALPVGHRRQDRRRYQVDTGGKTAGVTRWTPAARPPALPGGLA